ncbi:MAG TPA: hypothetical protein ENG42_02990 [Candidatus Aenigmarchaeota archaeon]|nr:MAG: hypothetical protein DRP03_00650 [Candidatus Aenigmarchaeota archaeon]HDD46416.1 hypothetical protein [Candidatus Aenigmarchaeota archaeon]
MKIKKLVAGSLATLATGATLAFGAFGTTTLNQGLQPYVQVDVAGNTLSQPAIVVGDNALVQDVLGAIDIATALTSQYAVQEKVIPSTAGVTSVSNGVLISSDLNKLYLGTAMNAVKDTITGTDLDLFANQQFTDKNAQTITYQQALNLSSQTVTFGTTTEFTEPKLYTTFSSSKPYYVKFYFLGGLDTNAVDSNYKITLLGKEYTFGPNTGTAVGGAPEIELYSATGTQTVTVTAGGDPVTVTIDGVEHTIEMIGWDTSTTPYGAILKIDGQATTPSAWQEEKTYTFPGTSTKVYVNDVTVINTPSASGGAGQTGSAQLFIGTDKLVFKNGEAVEKNDEQLTNTMVYITNSTSTKITSLVVKIAPDTDTYLADGGEYVDPVFGAFKFKLNGMTPGMTDSSRDVIKVAKDGTNKVKLTFTNKDGTEYAFDMFYYDSSAGAWERTYDGTHEVWIQEGNETSGAYNITRGDYFVVSDEKKTYVLKYAGLTTTSGKEHVTLQDIATGTNYDVYYKTDSYLRIGALAFKVKYQSADQSILVDLNGDGAINRTTVNMYTQGEAIIGAATMAAINVTENPLYTVGNDPTGTTINMLASYASNDVSFSLSGVTTSQIGTQNKYAGVTTYGTYVEHDTDSDSITVYYPGTRPAYVNLAVGADPVFSTTGATTGGTYKEAVPIYNPVAKFASEIPSTPTQDLILVGGPCANTLVKSILNEAWNTTDSCEYWRSDATLGQAGAGLLKVVENVLGSTHKALIVAGYSGDDTRTLAQKIMKPDTFAALSGDEWKGQVNSL